MIRKMPPIGEIRLLPKFSPKRSSEGKEDTASKPMLSVSQDPIY